MSDLTNEAMLREEVKIRDTKQAKFWNRIAGKYAKSSISDETSYQKKLAETQARMHEDMEVLELGCGTGSTALIHAKYVHHIWATDLSEEMLKIAESKKHSQGITNVDFQCASVESFQLMDLNRSKPFDMVLTMSLLHLLEDKDKALQYIYEWLSPGGYFISSTICMSEGFGFFRYILPIVRVIGFVPLVKFFTQNELELAITKAGFDIEYRWSSGVKKAVFIIARKRF